MSMITITIPSWHIMSSWEQPCRDNGWGHLGWSTPPPPPPLPHTWPSQDDFFSPNINLKGDDVFSMNRTLPLPLILELLQSHLWRRKILKLFSHQFFHFSLPLCPFYLDAFFQVFVQVFFVIFTPITKAIGTTKGTNRWKTAKSCKDNQLGSRECDEDKMLWSSSHCESYNALELK